MVKYVMINIREKYEDSDAYVGLMKNRYGAPEDYFEYWIGMFLPEGCEVPEGYNYIDLTFNAAGICWLKGNEAELFGHEGECYEEITKQAMKVVEIEDGACYFFERYQCPRYTTDEDGEVILDIGFFVE